MIGSKSVFIYYNKASTYHKTFSKDLASSSCRYKEGEDVFYFALIVFIITHCCDEKNNNRFFLFLSFFH